MMARQIDMYPDDVVIEGSRRAVSLDRVKDLAASIQAIGLQTPITVLSRPHPDGEDYGREIVLVAGLHRLEAAKQLGLTEIACTVMDNAADARMWEIAENLHRSELTQVERDLHIAEWIELCEAKNAVLSHSAKKLSARGRESEGRPEGGINAAARVLGIGKDAAYRAVKTAALPREILDKAVEEKWSRKQTIEAAAPPKPVKLAQEPRNDLEVMETQVARLMSAWNAASREAREEFMRRVDVPVFDNTRAA